MSHFPVYVSFPCLCLSSLFMSHFPVYVSFPCLCLISLFMSQFPVYVSVPCFCVSPYNFFESTFIYFLVLIVDYFVFKVVSLSHLYGGTAPHCPYKVPFTICPFIFTVYELIDNTHGLTVEPTHCLLCGVNNFPQDDTLYGTEL